jgi:hypothetical protein
VKQPTKIKNTGETSSKAFSKQQIVNSWYQENKDNIDWSIKTNRDRFRETTIWKNFVKRVRKNICEFCSCTTSHSTLHHIYPDKYDLLEKELFASLCYSCHTKISILSRRKNRETVPEYFLPFLEERKQ